LKRIIIVAAVAAVVALGVGVTVGHLDGSTAAPPPATTTVPQTWDQRMCEQAAKRLRARHPDAYIGGCNHGVGTIATP
jgi:hypothetical protein